MWKSHIEVPPRLKLGSLDSESKVLTITPWDPLYERFFCVFVSFEVTKPLSDIRMHPNSLSTSKVSTQIFDYYHQFAPYCAIDFST